MSATPRIDAVAAWIAAGRAGDIDWPEGVPRLDHPVPSPPYFNPVEWLDETVRLEAALRMIGGAPAELPNPPTRRTRRWRKR